MHIHQFWGYYSGPAESGLERTPCLGGIPSHLDYHQDWQNHYVIIRKVMVHLHYCYHSLFCWLWTLLTILILCRIFSRFCRTASNLPYVYMYKRLECKDLKLISRQWSDVGVKLGILCQPKGNIWAEKWKLLQCSEWMLNYGRNSIWADLMSQKTSHVQEDSFACLTSTQISASAQRTFNLPWWISKQ